MIVNAVFTWDEELVSGGTNLATFRFAPERQFSYNAGVPEVLDMLEPLKMMYPWASYADLYVAAALECLAVAGGPKVSTLCEKTFLVTDCLFVCSLVL